jgi:hypothetical protein
MILMIICSCPLWCTNEEREKQEQMVEGDGRNGENLEFTDLARIRNRGSTKQSRF